MAVPADRFDQLFAEVVFALIIARGDNARLCCRVGPGGGQQEIDPFACGSDRFIMSECFIDKIRCGFMQLQAFNAFLAARNINGIVQHGIDRLQSVTDFYFCTAGPFDHAECRADNVRNDVGFF